MDERTSVVVSAAIVLSVNVAMLFGVNGLPEVEA